MSDLSEFEEKYFINGEQYNCPFCNVRGAKYSIVDDTCYHENDGSLVNVYIVSCDLCLKSSIHLSKWVWDTTDNLDERIPNPFKHRPNGLDYERYKDWKVLEPQLDSFFFYHHPSSFFTIDERIPEKIRRLVSEAENCKEMNFMVGASGTLRKAIYKFLKHEKAEGDKYDDKIADLKTKHPEVKPEYFDAIRSIKDMNDQDMHEEDWEPFKGPEFGYLVESLKSILTKIYVEPAKEANMWKKIQKFKEGRKKVEDKTSNEEEGE